ncbi:MAG: prolyl oligopeptidase family serine peptidase [Acidimicrobiia bacterium]|nr:prolyl oligopeptidase family serine peptidase [Acidimicrobiia bacterium]
MPSPLVAGPPLEVPRFAVGRSSTELVDPARGDRRVPVDVWFPASGTAGALSGYEILPGVGFTASATSDAAIAAGPHPAVLWSHGRTGTRSSYVLLCEALAARGFVVVAPEHTGDALGDWITGAAVDDETNEANRIGDAHFVLDALLDNPGSLAPIAAAVDPTRIAAAGHSYGGFTALSLGSGNARHAAVRAVAGMQSFTRTMPKQVFVEMEVPTLLAVGARDATTPPETDADRAWAKLGAPSAWRVDVARAGHQACSDVGLYVELAPHVEGVPDLVRAFVASMAADITGTAGDPWRPTVALHAQLLGAFLEGALGIDAIGATNQFAAIGEVLGVTVDARGGF